MARRIQRIRDLDALRNLREQLSRDAQAAREKRELDAAEARRAKQAATEFAQAVRGATPLATPVRRAGALPAAAGISVTSRTNAPSPRASDFPSVDETSYRRSGIGPDVARKLRRGHWPVEGELDLHGMNSDEAFGATRAFLDEALDGGRRCMRLIHGKGLGSAGGAPVLKGKVRAWLQHRDDVLGYCEAPPAQGGTGALLVLLRAKD